MSSPVNIDVKSISLTVIENYLAMASARCLPNFIKSISLNWMVASVSVSV